MLHDNTNKVSRTNTHFREPSYKHQQTFFPSKSIMFTLLGTLSSPFLLNPHTLPTSPAIHYANACNKVILTYTFFEPSLSSNSLLETYSNLTLGFLIGIAAQPTTGLPNHYRLSSGNRLHLLALPLRYLPPGCLNLHSPASSRSPALPGQLVDPGLSHVTLFRCLRHLS